MLHRQHRPSFGRNCDGCKLECCSPWSMKVTSFNLPSKKFRHPRNVANPACLLLEPGNIPATPLPQEQPVVPDGYASIPSTPLQEHPSNPPRTTPQPLLSDGYASIKNIPATPSPFIGYASQKPLGCPSLPQPSSNPSHFGHGSKSRTPSEHPNPH